MRTLIEAFSSPEQVFAASRQALCSVPGVGRTIAENIKSFDGWARVDKELDLARRWGVALITFQDAAYPASLTNIYDSPVYLYVKGTLSPVDVNLAVVGSRRASAYGKLTTERLSRELALKGITIVSGMARGIDASAHRGALAVRGRTIAVLGSGIDVIYPPEHKKLYEDIQESGAVVSEFPLGTPPAAPNFPARNRIISGMSLGVVVAEASEKSGSLITARIALEQGREVFAIPGSIDSSGSRGTHKLIKEGATLVENGDDILSVIVPQIGPSHKDCFRSPTGRAEFALPVPDDKKGLAAGTDHLGTAEAAVLALIAENPIHIDTIIQTSGLGSAEVLKSLLTLELYELVRQMPGKMYVRKEGKACLNR